jgi:hypothetical protein
MFLERATRVVRSVILRGSEAMKIGLRPGQHCVFVHGLRWWALSPRRKAEVRTFTSAQYVGIHPENQMLTFVGTPEHAKNDEQYTFFMRPTDY